MHSRGWLTAIAAIGLALCARSAPAADDATVLRVFLTDGTALVSYGEAARVGDRVIFSMPTAATPNPPLQLVDLPVARVDWDRTSAYAAAARASHYAATQGAADFAALTADVSRTLADAAMVTDSARRLTILQAARQRLADWPQSHFNYKAAEVRQILSTLDEAIADVRAANGDGRIDLSFSAFVDPPTLNEPLLPAPTPREAIEQVLAAARAVDSAAERKLLMVMAMGAIDRDAAALPAEWGAARRAELSAALKVEDGRDRAYQLLARSTLAAASARAQAADVRGLSRLIDRIHLRDAALGSSRPEAVAALISAVEEKLDAARRLQLARDRWALRAPAFHEYSLAIRRPVDLFIAVMPSLDDIKSLAGSTPASLSLIERTVREIVALASGIAPPEELASAHALFVSAVQLAGNAARMRREAALAGDMTRAWNASSAAAGALMLAARARTDMQTQLRPPQLR
jgi:hypothetical protein